MAWMDECVLVRQNALQAKENFYMENLLVLILMLFDNCGACLVKRCLVTRRSLHAPDT
jgi:hypothetical protein